MMAVDRNKLKEQFANRQAKSNQFLERLAEVLRQRQGEVEAAVQGFSDLVQRHHQLQQAEAGVRRTKHECRRSDQGLADAEDRRDVVADRLDQFHRVVASAEGELETKAANYRRAIVMLKEHMGVEVRRRSSAGTEPGTVTRVITLTRVDQQDPERPFHVQYKVVGSRVTLVNTKPSLGDLSEQQAELDESGNLGLCMAQLRGRFQQLARQQVERKERRALRAAARRAAPAPV